MTIVAQRTTTMSKIIKAPKSKYDLIKARANGKGILSLAGLIPKEQAAEVRKYLRSL